MWLNRHFIYCITCIGLLYFAGCNNKQVRGDYPSPNGYQFNNPVIIHLKGELDEISGIFYYPKDTSIFAIIDEAGYLYKIFVRKKIEVEKWRFSIKADYEDLALVDSNFYALNSNGAITSFTFTDQEMVEADVCQSPLAGRNEFESMYHDLYNNKLVLICKDCKTDKKNSLTAFGFDPTTRTFGAEPYFVMDVSEVATKLGLDKMKLKPSAAAIHPITKELYIIASVNKALIIADRDGKVKEAFQLDPILFKQPEGLTFTPEGDLIISNEAAEVGAPNILIFKYKETINEKG